MPFPPDLQTILVTGTYLDGQGNPLTGQIMFTLPTVLVDTTGKVVVGSGTYVQQLNGGQFSIGLLCTDNATVSPTGFAYAVNEYISGATRHYLIELPHTLGPTVDISTLAPSNPPTPYSTIYGVLASANSWSGANAFAGRTTVPTPVNASDAATKAYVDSGGGVAAVESVNGHTGAVVLGASDVSALAVANNLSDVGSATTSRTNLGLGNSATRNVGSTAGTVAAGDDSRITGAIQPGNAATTVSAGTSYGVGSAVGVDTTYAREDHQHGTVALSSSAPAITESIGQGAAVGTASVAARADHVHPLAPAATPTTSAVGDSTAAGVATTFAASNHVHGREGFGVVTAQVAFAAAAANGTAVTVSHSDHAHGTPALPPASTSAAGVVELDGTASDIAPLGTQAAGAIGKAADSGHVHAMPRLDQVGAPTAAVGLNSQKITALANGTTSTDAATFGQIPAALPPNGAASGDLSGTYPSPTVTGTHLTAPLPVAQGGTGAATQNFVDLTTGQNIGGVKTFTGEVVVPAPVNPTDAVTKSYADAIASGLSVKPSVRLATAAALPANTYSNGAAGIGATITANAVGVLAVDGLSVNLGDRVLVQAEATAANNGLYACTTAGASGTTYVLTRTADLNSTAQVPGAFVFVEAGTVNVGAGFTVASAGPFTIGTTAIAWTQFSGAGEIAAGAGLTKTGNTLALTAPVSASNLPSATTSALGVVQLDGTAGDIAALGVQAAGVIGKAADAGHVHPTTGLVVTVAAPSGDVTGATDTPALNAAITAANTAGGGTVWLQAGTYWVSSPVVLRSTVTLRGAGVEATIIKLATAANCDVVQGLNFTTLTLTGASTWAVSGIWDAGLRDLTVDGNRANQSAASWGVRIFGYNLNLTNLDVRACYTDGLWTEWGLLSSDAPATTDGSESIISNVKTHANGRHGWMFLGPSDCRLYGVMAFKNNQAAGSSGIGFWGLQDRYSNILATAVSMNGTAASAFTGTFNVNAATPTDLYAASGTLTVTTSAGTATMTYTGKTSTSFTGCTVTSGTGNFQTGDAVVSSTSRFTINGMQMVNCHSWSNDHTWAAVIDGQASISNCHWEGARYGQLLIRNSVNVAGAFIYDFSPIATGCGIQLGDDGTTLGLPSTFAITANSCHINTRLSSILQDTALRAGLRWVSATQSNVQLQNVTKTTGVYTTTVAAGSNGVDISTWAGAGTLTVASTNQIPDGAGALTVATSNGTFTCTYTGNNVVIGLTRTSGNQFTGLTATGSPPGGSLLSTGGAVALAGIGTFAYSGTLDPGSRAAVQSAGPSTAVSTAASVTQEFGPKNLDLGVAANGFRLKTNGVDNLNVNTSTKQLQLPNAQQIVLYSDNYSTTQMKLDGSVGVITGPLRGGKNVIFPGAAWVPGDHGLVTWNADPVYAGGNTAVPTAGTVNHIRVHCPVPFTATNVILYVVTAGGTLTAGQCFAGLCTPAGTMLATTADLSSGATSFATGGSYTFPLVGGPYTNQPAGDYTVCFFFNGTTGPSLARLGNVAANLPNLGLTNGTYRHFIDSTNTGRTTSFPTNKGTETANGVAWFAAIS